ncbi:hypothetical protein ACPCHT_38080 [Nucisporomicrobium flavum]|uniref:hypothetical protein n=1 Tax=Nucisporomicrobium flavum TaxID=2785915 RepID=UPI003C30518E
MAFLTSVSGVAGWVAPALVEFLILVTVLALVSALSKHPSRRDAAYRTLALIWTRQPQDEKSSAPDPDAEPPALPPGRRRRRRR